MQDSEDINRRELLIAGAATAAASALPYSANAQASGTTAPCEPLDGGYLGAFLHYRECQAGIDAPAIDQHRAGAALAVVAALLGASQVEMIAQRVQ